MPVADIFAFLTWLGPAIPVLVEAFKKGEAVETVFAVNKAALDVAFSSARSRRAKRRPPV